MNESFNAAIESAKDAVEKAFEDADGEWTGLDWTSSHGVFQIDIDGMDADDLRSAAKELRKDGETDHLYYKSFVRDSVANDLPVNKERCADEMESAATFISDVETSAAQAQEWAEEAIKEFCKGNYKAALKAAEYACSLESEYGDCPTWRQLRDAIEAFMDLEKEMPEDEAAAFKYAKRFQGFTGTFVEWLALPPAERDEYEQGAAGIPTS